MKSRVFFVVGEGVSSNYYYVHKRMRSNGTIVRSEKAINMRVCACTAHYMVNTHLSRN